jgi:ribA/ribD-fused uncharacterized protein
MKQTVGIRTYKRSECIVFHKTKEAFGALSNMAPGFPILINNHHILTSEALYQACRFPNNPEAQELIISQTSPMTAKMRAKPLKEQTRADWMKVRVRIMRWCLNAKLLQNYSTFSKILIDTQDRSIVEHSSKDRFWGALPTGEDTLVGANVLGRLLMELRNSVQDGSFNTELLCPPEVINFLLNGSLIGDMYPVGVKDSISDLFE